jgi:multidrug resistance protein, MATE family
MHYIKEYTDYKYYKLIIIIAIPMIISNISTPLLGIIDTSIIGRISIDQIAAIAIGSTLLSFIYFCFSFFRMGTTGLIAQAWGIQDLQSIHNIIRSNIYLAILCGIFCIIFIFLLKDALLTLFSTNSSIHSYVSSYINIRIVGAPATFINFVIFGFLLGSNKPWDLLKLVLFINTLNIILDIYLGLHLNYQLNGIAYGTIISEYCGVLIGFYFMRNLLPDVNYRSKAKIFKNTIKNIFISNFNLFIRTSLILTSILMFTAIGSRLGNTILAANAILIMLQMFMSYSLDGFAQAAEVLVGNEFGKKNKRNIIKIVVSSGMISFIFSFLYFLIFYLFIDKIIVLITPLEEVLTEIQNYTIWILISPLISFLSFHMDGVFIGANKTRIMKNTVIISFIIFIISLCLLVPIYKNDGLWVSFLIFMFFRGILLLTKYRDIYKFN